MQHSLAILKVFLKQDSGNNIVGGIDFQYGFNGRVEVLYDWGSTESFLKFIKYQLTFMGPLKRIVLF